MAADDGKVIARQSVRLCNARLSLAGLLALFLLGLSPAARPQPRRLPPAGEGDAFLHLATIERIRSGAGYYDAVGEGLRRGHYPTTRVFNWRTPAHYLLVATLSVPVAAILLQALALAAVLLTPVAFGRESLPVKVLGMLLQLGAVATAVKPMAVGVAEIWAGVLIGLSLCAYCRRAWSIGALLGIAAVFTRELAAPYCAVCGLLALRGRRSRESYIWIAGGVAYAVYFGLHMSQVRAHQLPGDLGQPDSWVRWNGLRFILDTVRVNGWLSLLPRWVSVLCVLLALSSAAAPEAPRQLTSACITYFLLFIFIGQPFNYYWGFVTAPIWALAAALGIDGLRTLVVSARQPPIASELRA